MYIFVIQDDTVWFTLSVRIDKIIIFVKTKVILNSLYQSWWQQSNSGKRMIEDPVKY